MLVAVDAADERNRRALDDPNLSARRDGRNDHHCAVAPTTRVECPRAQVSAARGWAMKS